MTMIPIRTQLRTSVNCNAIGIDAIIRYVFAEGPISSVTAIPNS